MTQRFGTASAFVDALVKKFSGSSAVSSTQAPNLQMWLGYIVTHMGNETVGAQLMEIMTGPATEIGKLTDLIKKLFVLKELSLDTSVRDNMIINTLKHCGEMPANELQALEIWLRHPKAQEKIVGLYIVAAKESSMEEEEADSAAELDTDSILEGLAKAFGIDMIDLTVEVKNEADIEEYLETAKAKAKEAKKEAHAAKKSAKVASNKNTTIWVLGIALGVLLILSIVGFIATGKEAFTGFGNGMEETAVDPNLVATDNSATTMEVFDAAQGNGLMANPASPHTRQDNGTAQGLYTDISMYPEFQNPAAILERNTYYTVAKTSIPGVLVVDIGGNYLYAPESAFLQTGQIPATVNTAQYPGLAEKVTAPVGSQTTNPALRFSWLSEFGILLAVCIVLYVGAKVGEAKLDGLAGMVKTGSILGSLVAVLMLHALLQDANLIASAVALLAVILIALLAAVDPKLMKVGEILETGAADAIPAAVWTIVPKRKENPWAILRKVIEFSDLDWAIFAMMVLGIINPKWSPLFVLLGTVGGVLASVVLLILIASLEMRARDADENESGADKRLLMIAIISAIITAIFVGMSFFTRILPELWPTMPEGLKLADWFVGILVILLSFLAGFMNNGQKSNYANDDRLYDFLAWLASFNGTAIAFLFVIAAMAPIWKVFTIAVAVIGLVYLLIRVVRTKPQEQHS